MAWGRKKSGGRKEPLFGLAAALSDLRLGPQDRIPSPADDKPKKQSPKRKTADSDDDAPRERKPPVTKSGSKRRSKGRARGGLYRLGCCGAGPCQWGVMPAGGDRVWDGGRLPGRPSR